MHRWLFYKSMLLVSPESGDILSDIVVLGDILGGGQNPIRGEISPLLRGCLQRQKLLVSASRGVGYVLILEMRVCIYNSFFCCICQKKKKSELKSLKGTA